MELTLTCGNLEGDIQDLKDATLHPQLSSEKWCPATSWGIWMQAWVDGEAARSGWVLIVMGHALDYGCCSQLPELQSQGQGATRFGGWGKPRLYFH